jgi:hypothetical protein
MSGELYRFKMRVAHRFGYCKPDPSFVQEGAVWCHWCGMRGRVTTAAQRERAVAEMSAHSDGADHER